MQGEFGNDHIRVCSEITLLEEEKDKIKGNRSENIVNRNDFANGAKHITMKNRNKIS